MTRTPAGGVKIDRIMRTVRGRSIVFALAVAAAAGSAQGRPDFSGTWTFDQAATAQAAEAVKTTAAAMLGDRAIATQDATALTLTIEIGQTIVRAVYRLDGAASVNQSPAGPGQPEIPV